MINGLHFHNLRGDVYGGITAAIIALPLALAFGVSSGAGAIAGLYGAICVGFFAALFGGTPAQISGPTGPMTILMAAIFTEYSSLDPVAGPALAFTIVVLAGIMQMALAFFRVGRYINYVPLPVISGFMSGIGVIVILLQLGPLFGHPGPQGPLAAIQGMGMVLSHIVWPAFSLGAVVLVIVYCTPSVIARWVPSPLLGLISGTVIALLFTSAETVTRLGDIPSGLPEIQDLRIDMALLPAMLVSAAALALLGSIDSLLTSLVADNITHSHHKSDRELFGQGLGNIVAGLLGGLPGAGATMRTVVNVKSGGQTPISGALHGLILLAIVLGLGGAAEHIPHVVLAGILIKVGTDIIDWKYLKRIPHTSRSSVFIMLLVLVLTVSVDLITAFAIGMACAALVFLKRESDEQLSRINIIRGGEDAELPADEKKLLASMGNNLVLCVLGGPISFGAAKGMVQRINAVDEFKVLILDLQNLGYVDTTTARALEDIIKSVGFQDRTVIVSGAQSGLIRQLARVKTLDGVPAENIINARLAALIKAEKYLGA